MDSRQRRGGIAAASLSGVEVDWRLGFNAEARRRGGNAEKTLEMVGMLVFPGLARRGGGGIAAASLSEVEVFGGWDSSQRRGDAEGTLRRR